MNDCCMCRYLTGNPCTEYEGYWEYVIATLPRLQVWVFQAVALWQRIALMLLQAGISGRKNLFYVWNLFLMLIRIISNIEHMLKFALLLNQLHWIKLNLQVLYIVVYKNLDGKEIEKSDRIRALQVIRYVLHYGHGNVSCVLYF